MIEPSDYPLDGGCQCGHIRYRVKSAPLFVVACHCMECQKQSASAFGLAMGLRPEDLEVFGELKVWERVSDNGNVNWGHFCPECGVRIYHSNPDQPELIRLRPGTLSRTQMLEPTMHLWTSRKLPWVVIPDGVDQYETQPDY